MKPVVLVILDGWAVSPETRGNAIYGAAKPNFDFIEKNFPFVLLQASGVPVGLPWGEPGNSEVGHTALGTGQIWQQSLIRITLAIQNGSFFTNPVLKKAAEHAKNHGSSWHLVGLLGSGSVHSYIDHLYALIETAKNENVAQVWLHLFTDGRDSPPKEAAAFVENMEERLAWLGVGRISGLIGRHYGMDRDLNWDRTQKAYRLLTEGAGERATDFPSAIKKQYQRGLTDEFLEPIVFVDQEQKPQGLIKDGDVVIFFDFREDSARQLARSFARPNFNDFQTKVFKNLFVAAMTRYENGLNAEAIFSAPPLKHTVGELLAENKKTQFRIAETEKYAHITYFFNGGQEEPAIGEERKLVHSPPVANFGDAPEMKAREIAAELIRAIESGRYDFLLANLANADMLGHSGNYAAAVRAVEVVDEVVGQIMAAVLKIDGALIITADHGNADQMLNRLTGETYTEHTANPAPFYLIMNALKREKTPPEVKRLKDTNNVKGILQDAAASVLDLLGIAPPGDLDGSSLLPLLYSQ